MRALRRGLAAILAAVCLTVGSAGLCQEEIDIAMHPESIVDNMIAPLRELPVKESPTLEMMVRLPSDVIDKAPEKGEFLESGEYCYKDEENGRYVYASPTLHIQLVRHQTQTPRLVWHEAEVWTQGGELVKSVGKVDGERTNDRTDYLNRIALNRKIVLGVSTDFVHNRRYWGSNAGIMIREGIVLNDRTYSAGRLRFPNNDNLALFPDGDMRVYLNGAHTAQEFLDMGAYDVFSFGPMLVKGGVANLTTIKKLTKESAQRVGVGIYDKGHYLMIMCEGRHSGSRGATLTQLAELFVDRGIREAFNMDGGQSSSMVFMGKAVFDTSAKQTTRKGGELLSVGTSELVGR